MRSRSRSTTAPCPARPTASSTHSAKPASALRFSSSAAAPGGGPTSSPGWHDEGHLVGNHSFDHHLLGLTGRYRYWTDEIRRTDEAIAQIIGRRPVMFRPPMGIKHWHLMNAAADAGHDVVTWSRRALDGVAVEADVILSRLATAAQAGDVLLLHDGNNPHLKPQDRAGTIASVRPLIDGLKSRGLTPARLDELLGIPAYREGAASA